MEYFFPLLTVWLIPVAIIVVTFIGLIIIDKIRGL